MPLLTDEKTKELAVRKKYPNVTIEVDGGVQNLVVGSAIWKAVDIKEIISQFNRV